jgi:outer membrane protein OmpA-like peptidoglycan-associated protein
LEVSVKNRIFIVLGICMLAFLPACATKKSLKTEVARIDSQMGAISSSVEANESRIKEQDSRIATHDEQIASLSRESQEALQRVMSAEKLAQGKLLYEVTLADDSVKFDYGKAQLRPVARETLDNLVNQLKADNHNVYVEIQGHTDSAGPEEYNYKLGLERAENVRRYLSEAGIPLHRISIISYGEERPLVKSNTSSARRQNRRVVIQVLA